MPDFGSPLVNLACAAAGSYVLVVAVFPIVRRGGRVGGWATASVVAILFASPLIVPPELPGLRAIAAFVTADMAFRVVDFFRQASSALNRAGSDVCRQITWGQYAGCLIPFPVLLAVWGERPPWKFDAAAWKSEPVRVTAGACLCAAAVKLLMLAHQTELLQTSFALDHLTMVVAYIVAVESLAAALVGIEHLAGFATTPLIRRGFLSRTPAEYWLRYNTRVQRWLQLNVFVPVGGRRNPARGIVAVFFVSAVLHEVAFDIATSSITGYQAAFFLLQIPAVLLSRRLEMFASDYGHFGDLLARLLTFAWFAVTSVLFFDGVARIFPFIYAR
jgi:hypothetical protein